MTYIELAQWWALSLIKCQLLSVIYTYTNNYYHLKEKINTLTIITE